MLKGCAGTHRIHTKVASFSTSIEKIVSCSIVAVKGDEEELGRRGGSQGMVLEFVLEYVSREHQR